MKKILLGDEISIIFHQIGDTTYGVDIQNVVSIVEANKLRTVPLVPKYINSILNYHGCVVTVFDMKSYFNCGDPIPACKKKVIYLKHKELQIGILVDSILKIDYVSQSYIEPMSKDETGTIKSEFCEGLYTPDEDSPGIHLLDPVKILEFLRGDELINKIEDI